MRLLRILLVCLAPGTLLLAQTNAPAPASATAPATVKQLSLQDAIQLALQHNLDLQIDRYNPTISLYTVQAYYGAYDPTLSLSGQHDHNEAGSRLLGGGFSIPGSRSDDDSFSGGLSGLLPWGTTYNLQANSSDTYGNSFTLAPDFSRPISVSTNSFTDINTGNVISTLNTNFAQVPVSVPFENSGASASINVSQPLLRNFWIDATRLNIRVAKNRLKYTEQTLRLQIMATITTLEQAYYDLIYARETVVVQEKAVELAQRLVAENRKRVEVGALAPLDEQQAEAQAATSQAALIQARANLEVQVNLIKQLITDRYSEWESMGIEPTGTLTAPRQFFNLRDSWSKGLVLRPEIVQARLDLEQTGIQLKYAKNQLFPEVDVFGTYGYNGSGKEFSNALDDLSTTDRPFWAFGGRLSVPLSQRTARYNYRAQKVSAQQAVLAVKRTERDIMVQIDNDIKRAQAAYEAVAATKAAREYAQAALDAEQKKLESGKSTTYTVLQMQRDLTTARGNEIQALDAYNRALSQLSLDEGTTLERLQINLDVK